MKERTAELMRSSSTQRRWDRWRAWLVLVVTAFGVVNGLIIDEFQGWSVTALVFAAGWLVAEYEREAEATSKLGDAR